jgi:hypothetical protein
MCGLVGMISRKDNGFLYKDKTIFEQLLFNNTVRGVDSTGVFGVNKYGNLISHKTAQAAPTALRTTTFNEFLGKIFSEYRIVVGHNRASTRGATTDENAHPFIEDNICLVHNGTLHSHKQLADKEVDSHAICHSLATVGYEETFKKIDGAYALIWYDANTKKLYMARNKERPLHMAVTPDAYYFASELKMLDWILSRNSVNDHKGYFLIEDKTYIWDLDKPKDYVVKDTPKKSPPQASNYGHQSLLGVTQQQNNYPKKKKHHRASRGQSGRSYPNYELVENDDDYDEGIEYRSGEPVEIYNKGAAESKRGNLNLIGYTLDGANTPITCRIPENLTDDAYQSLVGAEYLQATVSMIHTVNGKQSLYMRDPIILEDTVTTANHKEITREMLEEHGGSCNVCKKVLTIADKEDIEGSIAVMDGNKLKNITCTDCSEELASWGCVPGQYAYNYGDY